MSRKIKVIIKQPHKKPYLTYISSRAENLKKTVGGDFEKIILCSDFAILHKKADLSKETELNCIICRQRLFGTAVFVGLKEDEISDIPCTFSEFKSMFRFL